MRNLHKQSNVFGMADDILTAGFDSMVMDHYATLNKVLRMFKQANQKFNKEKCLFRYTNIPFLSDVLSQCSVSPDPREVQISMTIPQPKCNYLSKFSPTAAEVCDHLLNSHL